MNTNSIAIFDSGCGGLTAMRHIRALLPHENIIYFGDTAHLPYGNKSPQTIVRYCLENIPFLLKQQIKLLLIACHTACSAALTLLREKFKIPIIGIIEQGIEGALEATTAKRIGVIGTRATIRSGIYQQQISHFLPDVQVYALACPLFVPLVEEGYIDHCLTPLIVADTLRPIKEQEIDTLILGCTHYPLLQKHIRTELGESVTLIDPASSCALKTYQFLSQANLLHPQQDLPTYTFYVTDDPDKFSQQGKLFLNIPIEQIFKVEL